MNVSFTNNNHLVNVTSLLHFFYIFMQNNNLPWFLNFFSMKQWQYIIHFSSILCENIINALFSISLVAEFGSFFISRNIIFFMEEDLIFFLCFIKISPVCNCSTTRNVFSFDEMKNAFILLLFVLFRPFSCKLQLCLSFLRKNTIM